MNLFFFSTQANYTKFDNRQEEKMGYERMKIIGEKKKQKNKIGKGITKKKGLTGKRTEEHVCWKDGSKT